MMIHLLFFVVATTALGGLAARLLAAYYLRPARLRRLLEELMAEPSLMASVMPLAEEHVDDFLRNKLPKAMPVVGMFIGDKTIAQFKGVFMEELEGLFPVFVRGSMDRFMAEGAGKRREQLIYKLVRTGILTGVCLGLLQALILYAIGPLAS